MEEGVPNSTPTMSTGPEPVQVRSSTSLTSALQQRQSRQATRLPAHTEGVQTLPTDDEMRQYQVPESKAPIWKLYEQKLRTVGRSQARIQQLTREIEDGNPPSWCFGGTQAPQNLRPFHSELVATTLEYAMKMAITARNILIRDTEQDAGQARHLQETLSRMYKQDKDPNFELATGRAEGIASHYNRKEMALNISLSEDDQTNIPDTVDEWAEMLCRRKVSKPNTRSRSRSGSKDNKKQQKKSAQNKPVSSKNQKKKSPPANNIITTTNKRSNQQPGPSYQQWKTSKYGAQTTAPRASSSNTSNNPRTSSSSTNQRGSYVQPNKQAQSASTQGNTNQRQTNLNEEELRLITLLRASKNDN